MTKGSVTQMYSCLKYLSVILLLFMAINLPTPCKNGCPKDRHHHFNWLKIKKSLMEFNNITMTWKIVLKWFYRYAHSECKTIFTIIFWLLKMCPTYLSPPSDIFKKTINSGMHKVIVITEDPFSNLQLYCILHHHWSSCKLTIFSSIC